MKEVDLQINPRLKVKLEQVFKQQSFKDTIEKQRKNFKIPKDGFFNYKKWKEWLNRKGRAEANIIFYEIWGFALKLTPQFDLNPNDAFWVESYLLFGESYATNHISIPIKDTTIHFGFDIEPDFNCSIEVDRDEVGQLNIKVASSASQKDIINFVKKNWWFIEQVQSLNDKKHTRFRRRKVEGRDEEIYKLNKEGLISNYGIINNASVSDKIKKIGTDGLRKIISKEKKRRK